jgi:hypothetical protein
MRTAALLSTAALVLGFSSTAFAGGYIAVGVGSDAEIEGDLAGMFDADGANNGRLSIGQRSGPLAIEASIFGTDLNSAAGAGGEYSTLSLGVDVKYYVSLTGPIEGYARGGLNKTWIGADEGGDVGVDMEGRGYSVGAGLQYSFRLMPLGEAALWLDYTHQSVRLYDQALEQFDGNVKLLTVGLSIGL